HWTKELIDMGLGAASGGDPPALAGSRGSELLLFRDRYDSPLESYRFRPVVNATSFQVGSLFADWRTSCIAAQADRPGAKSLVLVKYTTGSPTKTWNAARDFSAAANPNGVWSYGWSSQLGSPFSPDHRARQNAAPNVAGLIGWDDPPIGAGSILKNPTGRTILIPPDGSGDTWKPEQLGIHPGGSGEICIVRFTAPETARYRVRAEFSRINRAATTMGYVLKNGSVLSGG